MFSTVSPYFHGAPAFGNTAGSQNAFTEKVRPNVIGVQQSGENLRNFGLSLPFITVQDTDSLQSALEKLRELGGGRISLLAGTYAIKVALSGYGSITIEGVSPTATILDFSSTSANLSFVGTNSYSTGTITSITGTAVVGSSTVWSTNVVAGMSLFIGTRWYVIASVTDDTHLTLAESYGDNVSVPGAAYVIAYPQTDIVIRNVGIKNSTGTGLVFTDCRRVILSNVQCITNNVGIAYTRVSELSKDTVIVAGSTSDGIQVTSVGLCNWTSVNSDGNGGNGLTASVWKTGILSGCAFDANTGDGLNLTTVTNIQLVVDASANGGQGIEFVATSDSCSVAGFAQGNTSDGIKLTASSDNIHIQDCFIVGNGAYGVNIADSSCDNAIILGNTFASNSTAASTDSGTGTLIRSNIGLTDN